MAINKLKFHYKVYCNYCKLLNVKPIHFKDFNMNLFYVVRLLANSFYGNKTTILS